MCESTHVYVHKRHFRTNVREETWSLRYSRHVLKFKSSLSWINYITRLNKVLHTRTNVNVDYFIH